MALTSIFKLTSRKHPRKLAEWTIKGQVLTAMLILCGFFAHDVTDFELSIMGFISRCAPRMLTAEKGFLQIVACYEPLSLGCVSRCAPRKVLLPPQSRSATLLE